MRTNQNYNFHLLFSEPKRSFSAMSKQLILQASLFMSTQAGLLPPIFEEKRTTDLERRTTRGKVKRREEKRREEKRREEKRGEKKRREEKRRQEKTIEDKRRKEKRREDERREEGRKAKRKKERREGKGEKD